MEKKNVPYAPKRCQFCNRPMGIRSNTWYCSACKEFDDSFVEVEETVQREDAGTSTEGESE